MLLAGLGSIAAGMLLEWRVYVVVGIGLCVLVLIALTNYLRSAEVRIERQVVPGRVERNGMAISHLHVVNRGQRGFGGAEAVQRVGAETVSVRIPRLRRGETGERTVRLPTDRRGLFPVSPVEIVRRDPIRLVAVRKQFGTEQSLLVSPQVLPLRPAVNALTHSLEGKTDDMSPNGSMTFHQLREYVPGDDIRKIHWKATAKQADSGTLIVRQDVDNAQPVTTVVLDQRPSCYSPESFELAVDMAASVVSAANAGRSPFRLRLTDGTVIGGDNSRTVDRALEVLTEVQASPVGTVRDALVHLNREKGGAVLVVVTGMVDREDLQLIANMRVRFRRVMVVSVTPEPRPVEHFSGITVIQGSNLTELIGSWDVGVKA